MIPTFTPNLAGLNELELASRHANALKTEDYLVCAKIQEEVNNRILNDTINRSLVMSSFARRDSKQLDFSHLNGLFDLMFAEVHELVEN